MPNTLCDLRFCFLRNPFSTTQDTNQLQNNKKDQLLKHIYAHPDDFIAINPILNIKYVHFLPQGKIKTLCGVKNIATHDLLNDYKYLASNVKDFIGTCGMKLSEEVKTWVDDNDNKAVEIQPSPTATSTTTVQALDENINYATEEIPVGADLVPFLDEGDGNENVEKSIRIDWNYDVSSDKKLDYDEVCTLCINKAKTFGTNINLQDPNVIAIENKRRRELLNKIARYKRHREIKAAYDDDDISKMSLEQLETFATELETRFGQLKLKEVSRQLLNTSSRVYDMIFPNGIPIGSDRHINFNGFGDGIIKELYTPSSTVGLACDNIIQKHNIKISDELTVMSAIITLALQSIKITKEKPKKNDDKEEEEEVEEEEVEGELQEVD